jgi:hypothetical protein
MTETPRITSELQYRATKRQVERLRAQIESFTTLSPLKASHPVVHLAGLEDMRVELEGLEAQVREYEITLRD